MGPGAATKIQGAARRTIARQKVRRRVVSKYERRENEFGKVLYWDVEEERRQAEDSAKASSTGGYNLFASKKAVKLASAPRMLRGETLGTPRTMVRRLEKEADTGEHRLTRERATREKNAKAFAERDKALEAVFELAQLKNAIDAAYRALKKKLGGPKFKRPPTKAAKDAEAAAAAAREKLAAEIEAEKNGTLEIGKQREAELKMIFRRYYCNVCVVTSATITN